MGDEHRGALNCGAVLLLAISHVLREFVTTSAAYLVSLSLAVTDSASIYCILVSITASTAVSIVASAAVSSTASALVSFAASTFAGLAQRVLVLRPRARAVAILAALATPIVPVLVLPTILMLAPLALWSRPLGWRSCSCVICPLPHQLQSTHP